MSTTYNDYAPETLSFINRMITAGFVVRKVSDGEDTYPFTTVEKAVEYLTAVDESSIFATSPSGKKVSILLIYGNSPGELACDWSDCPELNRVCDEHFAEWDGKPQPTKTR